MFNKKFDGKYENVRKPIIVNGLREIKPFKQQIEFKKPIPKPIPEMEAEPEPERESIP